MYTPTADWRFYAIWLAVICVFAIVWFVVSLLWEVRRRRKRQDRIMHGYYRSRSLRGERK